MKKVEINHFARFYYTCSKLGIERKGSPFEIETRDIGKITFDKDAIGIEIYDNISSQVVCKNQLIDLVAQKTNKCYFYIGKFIPLKDLLKDKKYTDVVKNVINEKGLGICLLKDNSSFVVKDSSDVHRILDPETLTYQEQDNEKEEFFKNF